MKRIVLICMAAVALLSALVVSAFALYGDIYRDNEINGKDAIKLAQKLARWDIEFSQEDEKNADVYYDGEINVKDAVKLAQYLAQWSDVTLGPTNNAGNNDSTGNGNGNNTGSDTGNSNVSGGDIEVGADDIFG